MAYQRLLFLPKPAGLTALLILGAIALAGCIDDSASQRSKAEALFRESDIAAARVAGTTIYQSDVMRAANEQQRIKKDQILPANDPLFQDILSELIDQRLLKLAALDKNAERVPEVTRRLEDVRERVLAQYFVEQQIKDALTDEALRTIYKSQSALRQNGQEANVRLIRVKTEAEIKAIAEKLAKGADFGKLASKISIDIGSQNNEGELGYVSRVMVDKPIADVVFTTQAGAMSKPFKTKEGWNIVEVLGFRKPQQASFEAMRPQLLQYQTYAEINTLMVKLREQSDVEILLGHDMPADNLRDETDDE